MEDLDEQDEQEIEKEREERLDPDNRPDNAIVDNTDREFDPKTGFFTDSEGADDAEEKFVVDEDELGSGGGESDRA